MVELLGYVLEKQQKKLKKTLVKISSVRCKMVGCLRKLPDQRYIQHLWEKSPTHIDHLGQTIRDHTWDLHEELLEHDQNSVYCQGFQWMETNHHADRIFLIQPTKIREISIKINFRNKNSQP